MAIDSIIQHRFPYSEGGRFVSELVADLCRNTHLRFGLPQRDLSVVVESPQTSEPQT